MAEDASAGDALAAVAQPLRYDSDALLCAIAGYPKSGCADQVEGREGAGVRSAAASSRAAAARTGDAGAGGGDGGPSAGLLGGIAAVVVLGAAAVWQARRRRG